MVAQPTGTVTLLFSDVEGSTRLLGQLGTERYAEVLELHRRLLREAFERQGGFEVGTEGDSFFIAFPQPENAVAAAAAAQRALAHAVWPDGVEVRVRMGLHTGEPLAIGGNYVGMDVHRAARIAAAAHGGQVLVSEATAALVDRTGFRDLGDHRFKDLAAAERVFQLGDTRHPPIRSLHRTNLPVPSTPFVGRERELAELAALLTDSTRRLVTVTGPGGAGKTRLALQAAAEAADDFPDGVYWAALAPLREPSALETTVAQALEVSDQTASTDAVVTAHAGSRAVLLLDNCEHLVDAVAALVRRLIDGCPRLAVICTSRERIGLRGEIAYAVPPMAASDGVSLFVERARAVAIDFEEDENVEAICDAVDELPLAIELAAARVRSMSTRAIRDRLAERLPLLTSRDREVDERHRTLEATIAWSYNLLVDDERRALRNLSVFVGGCTLAAAEAVAAADLELLESLLDKSLIRHRVDEADQDRYWLLETIREYAYSRLQEAGEEHAARQAYRDWYLQAASDFPGDGFVHTGAEIPIFRADRANFRAVLGDSLKDADVETALTLTASLAHLWHRAGGVADGYALARSALKLPGGDDAARGRALHVTADMAVDLTEFEEAHRLLDQAEVIAQRLKDEALLWRVYYTRSYAFLLIGNFDDGVKAAEVAAEITQRLYTGKARTMAAHMYIQALRTRATADPERPDVPTLEHCLELAKFLLLESETVLAKAVAHGEIASICLTLGRHDEALDHVQSELRLRPTSLGSRQTMTSVFLAGAISDALGEHERGVMLTAAALAAYESEGFAPDDEETQLLDRLLVQARAAVGNDAVEAAVRAGRRLDLEGAVEVALGVTPAGRIA